MILNRLPILDDTPGNQTLCSNFILESMEQLEPCFKIGKDDPTLVGLEVNYSITQQSIIADLVCLNILMIAAIESSGGNATDGTEALTTFLKKAKAGSVEVEWGPFDLKSNATLAMSAQSYFDYFKRNAKNKAMQLGCMIDICDDCSLKFLTQDVGLPFLHVGDCGCGNNGATIPEQG